MIQEQSRSPDSDLSIMITQTRCQLPNGISQTFSSRVVERDGIAMANSVGVSLLNDVHYKEVNVVTQHVLKPFHFGKLMFGDDREWCRLRTLDQRWDEYIADKSRGLSLNLGSGVTLEDVCRATEKGVNWNARA